MDHATPTMTMTEPLVHFVSKSRNIKTGPIATSMTEEASCPATCPFAGNGCYASYGRTLLNWKKVPDRGIPWRDFLERLQGLNSTAMFRHNVAGDLPHIGGYIIRELVFSLAHASAHLKSAWTYTHHELNAHNIRIIREINKLDSFTINVSCEDTHTAALNAKCGLPTVCVVLQESPTCFRVEGITFVQCPATLREDINCKNCGGPHGKPLCARTDRRVVVTFPAHGAGHKNIAATIRGDV